MALLEKNIRKKWETMKDFPFANIVFKKFEKKTNILLRNSTWEEMRRSTWEEMRRSIMKFFNDGR